MTQPMISRRSAAHGLLRNRAGAAAVEYALLVSLVTLILLASVVEVAGANDQTFTKVETQITEAGGGSSSSGG
ncbi:MAG: Flp family type IVb pilin [Pseudomonadota bacterium]